MKSLALVIKNLNFDCTYYLGLLILSVVALLLLVWSRPQRSDKSDLGDWYISMFIACAGLAIGIAGVIYKI